MLDSRRRQSAAFAFGTALFLSGLMTGLAWPVEQVAAQAIAPLEENPCIGIHHLESMPTSLMLGEAVDITRSAVGLCASAAAPTHIVLVLDGSAATAGEVGEWQLKIARSLVKSLDMRNRPSLRVGVVFGSESDANCPLSDNASRVQGCIGKVGAAGTGRWADGLAAAHAMLATGRDDVPGSGPPPIAPMELVVFFAAGEDPDGCDPALGVAEELRSDGVTVVTSCVAAGCATECLAQLATTPGDDVPSIVDGSLLEARVSAFARSAVGPIVRQLTLTHALPENVDYVADSAVPPPSEIAADGRHLAWRMAFVPSGGVTVTYKLRPLEAGSIALGTAGGSFEDTWGHVTPLAEHEAIVQVSEPGTSSPNELLGVTHSAYFPSVLSASRTSTSQDSSIP